jgi:Protein of unknown function (DUF1501)
MDRRDFLKLSSVAGISMFVPWGLSSNARAEDMTYPGPYFLHMHAGGGWDPTMFCDGKLTAPGANPAYENKLITEVTNIGGVPVPASTAKGKFLFTTNDQAIEDPKHFFETFGKKILVLNGVDVQTNNHDTGVQGFACGNNNAELPCLAALLAGKVSLERKLPMAFLAGGQYNRTGDIVSASRFPGGKINQLASPYAPNGKDNQLITDFTIQKIAEARGERFKQLNGSASLPRTKRTLRALEEATQGGGAINLLTSITKEADPTFASIADQLAPETRGYLGANNNLVNMSRGLESILRCFRAGVSASATYEQGGFDTHAQHDTQQAAALGGFVARLRYVMIRAAQMNIADKLYILVTSDFGRTPKYNMGAGRDHWNVTSSLVIGPGIRTGVVGKSDEGHKATRVVATDVTQTVADSDTSGVRIHTTHIHQELRRVLQLENSPVITGFPLPGGTDNKPLRLFG